MSQYQDPSQIKMQDGRSMADFMRRGPRGIQGVVVAKATAGGTPINFNPHDMSRVTINVVDADGQSVRDLAVGTIAKDRINEVVEAVRNRVPGDDIDSIRERAAMVFEELAKMENTQVVAEKSSRVVKKQAPLPPPAEEEEIDEMLDELAEEVRQPVAPPIEKIDRTYSPLAAFGLKKQKQSAVQTSAGGAIKTAGQVGPPQRLVYFEKEGIGTVPAFFHDIIVSVAPTDDCEFEESGFLVLVYDLRFEQNAARWFPPSNDPYQRPWAAQINGDSKLYLVHTTGFQYVYDSREYCVLHVEKAVIAPGL